MVKIKKSNFLLVTGCFLASFFIVIGVAKIFSIRDARLLSDRPLGNLSELSEEYMAKYHNDYVEMVKYNHPENVLIVTTISPIENTFGATMVVDAANHQHFLQYSSKEEKDNALRWLKSNPSLVVDENIQYQYSENTTGEGYNSWGIQKMGLDHMRELLGDYPQRNDVTVAIIDSGLDVNLFKDHYPDKALETYNSVNPSAEISDEVGHGTHIAGTVAEGTPDNVKILSVKTGEGSAVFTTDIVAAIDYVAYYDRADVINMSFSSTQYSDAMYLSIESAKQKGIVCVAAAGNSSSSTREYPSAFDNTISVSAVDENLEFASFSNYGSMISFTAPGVNIGSINGINEGTSMAAPHVTSAVAVAKSLKRELNFDETIAFLRTRAIDLGAKGYDTRYGDGFIDFSGAKLCNIDSSESCDDFSILEKTAESNIEIAEVTLTPFNYGSLTNILATKIRILNSDGSFQEKNLGDLGVDADISGYDPYATSSQQVTVKYHGFTANFVVENPEDYPSGWIYSENLGSDTSGISIIDYKDHGLNIKTLYFPETINGESVTGTYRTCSFFTGSGDYDSSCYGHKHTDTKHYETIIFPANITRTSGFSDESFSNLTKVVSESDELVVTNGAFAGLKALTEVDANILFEKSQALIDGDMQDIYAEGVFADSGSLASVRLSKNNTIIPARTFSQCSNLSAIDMPESVQEIGDYAFYRTSLEAITFGDNLKRIGDYVLAFTKLTSVSIPSSVSEITPTAFAGLALKSLQVANDNPVYDSRDGSNSIIISSENKLVVGTISTVIPESVESIAGNAFTSLDELSEITVPEGITSIESNAFANCPFLTKAVLPKSLVHIEEDSFNASGLATPSKTVFWVYDNTYALSRVLEIGAPYVIIDEAAPPHTLTIIDATYETTPAHRIYHALDTFSPESFVIKVRYYDENNAVEVEELETITNYSVEYHNQYFEEKDTLSGGMNFVTFTFDTASGIQNVKLDMEIIAWQLDPEYTIPADLTAREGQHLSEIALPEGFNWMDQDEVVDASVESYAAEYVPDDPLNYKTIRFLPLNVQVIANESFEEIFPDESFRECLIKTVNEQEGTNYTLETIPLSSVFNLEELSCPYVGGQDSIRDVRGIEKLTKLKTLDLSGNDIERINLRENQELTQLNLEDTLVRNLDLTKNLSLGKLLVNEDRLLDGEKLTVKSAAYLKLVKKDDGSSVSQFDFSQVGFLADNNPVFDMPPGVPSEQDGQTLVFPVGVYSDDIRVHLSQEGVLGETSFNLDFNTRRIIVSIYLDDVLFDTDYFAYVITGSIIDVNDIARVLEQDYHLSYNYVLENSVVLSANTYTVGESDVNLALYYKTIDQKDDIDDNPTGENNNSSNDNNNSNGYAQDDAEYDSGEDIESAISEHEQPEPSSLSKTPNTGRIMQERGSSVADVSITIGGLLLSIALIIIGLSLHFSSAR